MAGSSVSTLLPSKGVGPWVSPQQMLDIYWIENIWIENQEASRSKQDTSRRKLCILLLRRKEPLPEPQRSTMFLLPERPSSWEESHMWHRIRSAQHTEQKDPLWVPPDFFNPSYLIVFLNGQYSKPRLVLPVRPQHW